MRPYLQQYSPPRPSPFALPMHFSSLLLRLCVCPACTHVLPMQGALTPLQRLRVPHASLMVLDGGLGVVQPAATHVAPVHLVALPKLQSRQTGEGRMA